MLSSKGIMDSPILLLKNIFDIILIGVHMINKSIVSKTGYMGVVGLIASAFLFTVTTAHAAKSVVVKPNFIKINAVKYRRAGAESAVLASYGIRRAPAGKTPRFERKGFLVHPIKMRQATTIALSTKDAKAFAGEATAKMSGGTGTVSGSGKANNNSKYVLTKFEINSRSNAYKQMNKNPTILQELDKHNNKARFVTAVWVLVEGNEQQIRSGSGKISGDVPANGGGSLSGSHSSMSDFTFSAETIMAYSFDKIKWNTGLKNKVGKKGSKVQTIKDLTEDQFF